MLKGLICQNMNIYTMRCPLLIKLFLKKSIEQISEGVDRIILFFRKLLFSCLSKYTSTVSIFENRSELGNTIYRAVVLPVLKEQGYSLQIPVHGAN